VRTVKERLQSASQKRFVDFASALLDRAASPDAYTNAKDALQGPLGSRFDQYFRNYIRYQWARFSPSDAPSAIAYVCRLSMRVAMLRWALILRGAAAQSMHQLDELAVQTFQLFAKHLEQHPSVREKVDALID